MSATAAVTTGRKEPGAGNKRSSAVDGIRGIAALSLLTVHVAMFSALLGTRAFGTERPPSNAFGGFLVSGLPSAIGVFFVLPAMFLYLPMAKAIIAGKRLLPQRNNILRRLVRLLPAYYVMCLVAMVTLNRGAIHSVWYVLRPLALVQVYLPSPFVPKLMNGMEITWTVPTMVQWYLALPLIAWVSQKFAARGATPAIRARRLMLPVPVLIAIGVGWLFFVKSNGLDNRMVFWWPQGFAPTIGIGMALAIMLALHQVSPQDTSRLLRTAAAHPNYFWGAALVVYLVNCARPFSVIGMDAIYSTSGLLVTYIMVALFGLCAALPLIAPDARPSVVNNALACRPLAFLGRISFGIYLWHFAVMHFYLQPGTVISGNAKPIRELYGLSGFWQLELVTAAGSILIATLSYYLIERPVIAWADRHLRDRKPEALTASARPALPGPADYPPSSGVLTAEAAAAAAAAATADCEAIRANLLELDGTFGKQLLAGANLTGRTESRWHAATADLATTWELFAAYTAVVTDVTELLGPDRRVSVRDLTQVTDLLTGPSIHLVKPPAPLAQRHITDSGRTSFTPPAAVQRMNQLFNGTARLTVTAEKVWNEVTSQLDTITGELDRVRADTPGPQPPLRAEAIAAAEADLSRLREDVSTDPLSLSRRGRVDTSRLDDLRRRVQAISEV